MAHKEGGGHCICPGTILSTLSVILYCVGFIRVEVQLNGHKNQLNSLQETQHAAPGKVNRFVISVPKSLIFLYHLEVSMNLRDYYQWLLLNRLTKTSRSVIEYQVNSQRSGINERKSVSDLNPQKMCTSQWLGKGGKFTGS